MTCQHCGAALPPIAMFCGECGRSVTAAGPAPLVRPTFPPVRTPTPTGSEPDPEPEPDAESAREREPEPEPEQSGAREPASADRPDTEPESLSFLAESRERCTRCGTPAEPEDLYCAECGAALESRTRVVEPLPPAARESGPPEEAAPEAPVPEAAVPEEPVPEEPVVDELVVDEDTEATRMVPRTVEGHRFVLQFSTGESLTVTGSGLAGRHPRTEPGEYVDHLVTILDPGRSVSKTHFEFGNEQGVFWFSDRHSGNGSVIREPGAEPRLCEPGRRYRIVRGTRIDIGEQFVVVS
ncbi:MAG: zinc ribbon domain-containing protein [Microcella sp.]|uniref:zinc-ribbon domain-containing protein n=1 Tax=Microcella sp. TaxID=1913979 RepID=UPI0033155707